jgi:hypothetical protein
MQDLGFLTKDSRDTFLLHEVILEDQPNFSTNYLFIFVSSSYAESLVFSFRVTWKIVSTMSNQSTYWSLEFLMVDSSDLALPIEDSL